MLFNPTYNTEILQENEYKSRIIEVERVLSEYRNSGIHISGDGAKLYYEYYLANNSKGNIVVVHGFTEFLQKYYEMCWYFLQMGFSVFMYDQRGHGRSDRTIDDPQIVHIDCFDQYVDDLASIVSGVVMPNCADKPVYIYAHSMGAGVAAQYIYRESVDIQKCVLSSAMILPSTYGIPAPIVRALVKKDAAAQGWNAPFRFAGHFSANPDFAKSNDLSRARFDHQLAMRIADAKYQTSTATNRWIYEALSQKDKLLPLIKHRKIRTEMLVICAGRDKTVRVSMQKRIATLIPKARFACFGNARHTIYNGTTDMIERYVKLIIDFFTDQ